MCCEGHGSKLRVLDLGQMCKKAEITASNIKIK